MGEGGGGLELMELEVMRSYISCKINSNSLDKQTGMQSTSLHHNIFRRKTLGVGWPLQPVVIMNCVQGFLRKVTLGAMGPLQYLLLAHIPPQLQQTIEKTLELFESGTRV